MPRAGADVRADAQQASVDYVSEGFSFQRPAAGMGTFFPDFGEPFFGVKSRVGVDDNPVMRRVLRILPGFHQGVV
jgi:hypothetical protein